jgi:hypothetical protein
MRRIALVLAVVAVFVSLPVLAERVQLIVMGGPITLNGSDVIYVEHGWVSAQYPDGVWAYKTAGYHSFRAYALDRLSYRLFIDGEEIDPTAFHMFLSNYNGRLAWRSGWYFNFPPGSLPGGTHEFTGLYRQLLPDGTWYEATRTREVTIEY